MVAVAACTMTALVNYGPEYGATSGGKARCATWLPSAADHNEYCSTQGLVQAPLMLAPVGAGP